MPRPCNVAGDSRGLALWGVGLPSCSWFVMADSSHMTFRACGQLQGSLSGSQRHTSSCLVSFSPSSWRVAVVSLIFLHLPGWKSCIGRLWNERPWHSVCLFPFSFLQRGAGKHKWVELLFVLQLISLLNNVFPKSVCLLLRHRSKSFVRFSSLNSIFVKAVSFSFLLSFSPVPHIFFLSCPSS